MEGERENDLEKDTEKYRVRQRNTEVHRGGERHAQTKRETHRAREIQVQRQIGR